MTTYAATIVASGALTYAIRWSGFRLGDYTVPPVFVRFLHFVPIAAFSALVAPGLSGGGPDQLPRIFAAVAASIAVIRFGQLWLCVAVGMAVFWLTRAFF